jgi:tripartite-type tricarboxylate transporter receptor subunit TctC
MRGTLREIKSSLKEGMVYSTTILRILIPAVLAVICFGASAQEKPYPTKPIRFIVPFAAGGGADIVARLVGIRLTEGMGVQFIVDNRAGASSTVGDSLGARAAPDGYTINLITTSYAVNPSFYKDLPFHPVDGVTPIALIGVSPLLAVVHPAVPAKTIKDLIAHAKANPGKLNYASTGNGGLVHLYVELLKLMAGIDMVHIPYKGTGPALNELIAGQTQFFLGSNVATMPHVKSGRLRALAVTTAERSSALPDLPTIAESGVPGFEAVHWFAVLGPKGLPRDVVTRLNAELKRVVALPDVASGMQQTGLVPTHSSPEALRERIRTEVAKFSRIVKQANIRPE